MDVFLAGTDVTLSVPLVDKSGNPINVSTVSYRVTDQDDIEVVANTSLSSFSEGSETADILVPALKNALATGASRGLRSVELTCLVGVNTVVILTAYGIELSDPLQVGVDSFQTYSQAEFAALSMPNTPGWDAASKEERIAALIDARLHICQLSFSQLNSNINWGQDSLNFVPEGSYSTNYISANGMFMFNGNLMLLTTEQFAKLPVRFLSALRSAQIAEADNILGGDPMEKQRRAGLTMEAVGESKQSFRTGKPLELPVSRRALAYLSFFVTFSKKIGRS